MCEKKNCINNYDKVLVFSHNVVGSKDMKSVDKLFVDGHFDPLASHLPPLDELLEIPLQKELPKEEKKKA